MHLGNDFLPILVDFKCQVGVENRSKMASEKRLKKEGQQDGPQDAPRAYGVDFPHWTEPRERG